MAAVGTTHESGSVLGERFALSASLGTGASARVFLATDLRLQCQVAVKVLHQSLGSDARFGAQLRREARLAASLSHDHIVTILDFGQADADGLTIPYIATEYLAGGSLAGILDAGVTLDAAQVASLGEQAAAALAYAHEENVVHRDVKPSNLLFDADGRLALTDFGIARAIAEASATEPTDSGVGATRYASPEAVMGHKAEPRTDVYSLGLVLLECLTGEVPLLGDSPVATMGRRIGESVEVPKRLGRLGEALRSATRSDPEHRCSAAELAESLESASSELGEPDRLPLRPVVLHHDDTAELRIDRSDGSVKILSTAPMGASAHMGTGDPSWEDSDTTDYIDLTDEDSGHTDDAAEFGRDAITVAEEYHALDASRPTSHGVVEPLDVPLMPTPLDESKGRSAKARSRSHSSAQVAASDGDSGNAGDPTEPPSVERHRRRRWIFIAALVVLLLGGAAGAGWWFLVRVPTHEVPEWIGEDIAVITESVTANGWEVGETRSERRDDTTAGQVLAQDPAPGTDLSEGEMVSFTVSAGPTLTAVPSLGGMPEQEAVAQLDAAGLVPGARGSAFDETVPAGSVINAAPAAGSDAPDEGGQVPKETVIDYVVSDGPAPRVVPEGIVGVPLSDAEAALASVQLGVGTTTEYSSELDKGYVIRSDTAPGIELARDSVVGLVVSAGPEPIVVPDVTSETGTAAAAALEQAGFSVSGIEGSPSGAVLATDPPAGESRLPGAAVRVFTRTG